MILLPKIRLKKKLRSEKAPECYKKTNRPTTEAGKNGERWDVPKIMRAYKQTLLLVEISKNLNRAGASFS